jgi:hypothetical protein
MARKIIYCEDKTETAKSLIKDINIPYKVETKYYKTVKNIDKLLKVIDDETIILTDIHFGTDNEKLGITLIKEIRKHYPKLLIIVYSAYMKYMDFSYKAGADHFIIKDPSHYKKDLGTIHDIISREFMYIADREVRKCALDIWNKKTEIPAKVYKIEGDYVYLNCMIDIKDQSIVQKKLPRSLFIRTEEIRIDDPILLIIKERPSRMCYIVDNENIQNVNHYFLDKDVEVLIQDLSIFAKDPKDKKEL